MQPVTIVFLVLVVLFELAALYVLYGLWRKPVSTALKLVWTPVLFIPLFGMIFYGGFFAVPGAQSSGDQARSTPGIQFLR